jgi:hypothetical protein
MEYRFDGLDGFHETVGDAAVADEHFMDVYLQKEIRSHVNDLGDTLLRNPQDAMDYVAWLKRKYARDIAFDAAHGGVTTDEEIMKVYDDTDERWDYCADRIDSESMWDDIRSAEMAPQLLADHPIAQVKSAAYGTGIDVDKITFLCYCCSEPQTTPPTDSHFYCGACGCEAIMDEGDTLESWLKECDVVLYPYRKKEKA